MCRTKVSLRFLFWKIAICSTLKEVGLSSENYCRIKFVPEYFSTQIYTDKGTAFNLFWERVIVIIFSTIDNTSNIVAY